MKPTIIPQDIPGWSEFLISFSLIMFIGLLLFHPLRWLSDRKLVFWFVVIVLLFTTFFDYSAVTMNQIGLFIGTMNWKVLVGAAVSTGIFLFYYVSENDGEQCAIRFCLLMAVITALKKCMIERYEQSGSFRDPILLQLSEILDRKLNRLNHSQKSEP
jgi:hypothetical protein